MSQHKLKNEVDLNNQNFDRKSPRLASALGKLHNAIDELKQNQNLSSSFSKRSTEMSDEIEKLNNENVDLLHKLEELKQTNSRLKASNKEVESRISDLIKTYRNFLG